MNVEENAAAVLKHLAQLMAKGDARKEVIFQGPVITENVSFRLLKTGLKEIIFSKSHLSVKKYEAIYVELGQFSKDFYEGCAAVLELETDGSKALVLFNLEVSRKTEAKNRLLFLVSQASSQIAGKSTAVLFFITKAQITLPRIVGYNHIDEVIPNGIKLSCALIEESKLKSSSACGVELLDARGKAFNLSFENLGRLIICGALVQQ